MSDYPAEREAAKKVESQRPGWMVIWGVYSEEYVAIPLFRDGSGLILASGSTSALVTRMQEVESQIESMRRARKRIS